MNGPKRETAAAIRVGLLWHSLDSGNLGVGALTYSQLHLADEAARQIGAEVEFELIGWAREESVPKHPAVAAVCRIDARRLLGIDPQLREAIERCDLILDIGEGDSFSDIYGWKRLLFLAGSKLIVVGKGKPLVLSPQTLGPFRRPLARRLGDLAMGRARVVFSRDRLSTEYFRSRRLDVEFHEAIDVAFALPYERGQRGAGPVRVGINVSALLWAGGYSGNNQFGLTLDYRDTVIALIEHFSGLPGVEVVLVPHVVSGEQAVEDDLAVSRELARTRPGVTVAGPFADPFSAKSLISGLDFFVGARMHACIAAFSSGVPSVPMAYSRKFIGLFDTLGYPHVADCTREVQAGVLQKVGNAFEQRRALARLTEAGNEIAHERLAAYRDSLARIFHEVMTRA